MLEDICMINGILRKHKYHHILQRLAFSSGKRLCGGEIYKHFSNLCKLYLIDNWYLSKHVIAVLV